jgi:hypothetical protein
VVGYEMLDIFFIPLSYDRLFKSVAITESARMSGRNRSHRPHSREEAHAVFRQLTVKSATRTGEM